MEEIEFESQYGKLVGNLYTPEEKTNKVIIMAHGFTSNKDRPRSIKIAKKLSQNGFAVLRFDFGGSGKSYETEIYIEKQVNDLKSAINFVKKQGYSQIGLIGESLGGLICFKVYNEEIKTMVLFAPVTKAKTPTEYSEWEEEIEKKGFVLKEKDGKSFKINKEYIKERESINQKELLSKVRCPVLIINGTEDDSVPLEHSKEAMKYLSKDSKLEIIKGANHRLDIIHGILELSLNWFKKHL